MPETGQTRFGTVSRPNRFVPIITTEVMTNNENSSDNYSRKTHDYYNHYRREYRTRNTYSGYRRPPSEAAVTKNMTYVNNHYRPKLIHAPPEPQLEGEEGFLHFCSDWVFKTYNNALKPKESFDDYGGKRKIKTMSLHDYDYDVRASQVRRLMKCCQKHQTNLKNYYQFFKLCNECDLLGSQIASTVDKMVTSDDKRYRMVFKSTCNGLIDKFLQWSNKVKGLMKLAEDSVIVNKRIVALTNAARCRAVCSFNVNDVGVEEGEKFILVDNSDHQMWTIQLNDGTKIKVPAIYLEITGPDSAQLKRANRLQEDILDSRKKFTHYLESGDGFSQVIEDLYDVTDFTQTTTIISDNNNNASRSHVTKRTKKGLYMRRFVELKTRFTSEMQEETISHLAPEYSQYSGQQVQMFVITAVVDTSNFSEISLDEAKRRGIINQKAGTFYNRENGESITIQEAMSMGFILVEKTIIKRERETERRVRAGSQEDLLAH